MSSTKKVIVLVLILAGISAAGFSAYKQGWFDKTETAISTQDSAEKAAREKAEADAKAKADKIAKMQEIIDQMKKDKEDATQVPPANQIANPAPANPADTATAVVPIAKKKSGVGG